MPSFLEALGRKYRTDKVTDHGYHRYYEEQFSGLDTMARDCCTVLEIGVYRGASLRMWAEFFEHFNPEIIGVDNDPKCADACLDRPEIRVVIGDASDPDFVFKQVAPLGPFDLIIDDGSHRCLDQQRALDNLWVSLKPGGLYVIEDLHVANDNWHNNAFFPMTDNLGRMASNLMLETTAPGGDVAAMHVYPKICFLEKAF